MTVDGSYDLTGATEFLSGSNVTFNSASTVTSPNPGPLTVSGSASPGSVIFNSGGSIDVTTLEFVVGEISGTDDIAASGLFTWSSNSTMSGTGTTTANGGILLTTKPFTLDTGKFLGRTLVNPVSKTATWIDGSITIKTGGTIDNLGFFNVEHPDTESMIGGAGREFNNSGTFTKSVGSSTSIFTPFNNTGTMELLTGSLSLRRGGASTGDYDVSAGSTLALSGDTHSLSAASAVTGAGDVQIFSTVDISGTYNITGATSMVGNVTFNPGSTLTSLGAATVSFGTVTFNSGGSVNVTTLTQSGGTIAGADDITASDLFSWTGGTHGGTGTTTANSGISITSFSNRILGRTLTNPGGQTATMSGSGFSMEVFANFNNAGTFNAQQTSVTGIQGGSVSKFNNSGIFNKTEAGSMIIAADFNNTGSLNVQMGTLLLFRTNNATGAYDVSNGATLEFTNAIHKLNTGSSVAGLGTVKFSGGTVNISDTYNITGASEFTGGFVIFHPTSTLTSLGAGPLAVAAGSVTFNTDGPPIAVTTLDLSGGTITGTDDITASGLLTWTGSSTMSGTGATTANAGMSLNSTTTMSLGRTLTNPGGQTATWLDGDIQIDSGGQFDNLGIFSADHPDDQCICGGNTVTFNNVGTFNNIGIGITTIDVNFINNSPLNVIAGTLKLQAGSTSEGAYDVSAGATLEFTGGVHNLIAGSSTQSCLELKG